MWKQDEKKLNVVDCFRTCTDPTPQPHAARLSSIFLGYVLGMIIGRLRALSHASIATGEGPSVRMTLPIDMKNLFDVQGSESVSKVMIYVKRTQMLHQSQAYISRVASMVHPDHRHSEQS